MITDSLLQYGVAVMWEVWIYALKRVIKIQFKVCFIYALLPSLTSLFLPQLIQDIFNQLSHAFLIFPQFNFGNGLMQLARMDIEVQLLSGYGIDAYRSPYSPDALGWMFISSLIQGLVFLTLRLLLNKTVTRKIRWGFWLFSLIYSVNTSIKA